jgi:hypothetical protein
MITNFPAKSMVNQGGYKSFKFLPFDGVISFPAITSGMCVAAVEIKAGYSWLKGYATPETLSFAEPLKDSENGNYYEQNVSGFTPGNTPQLISLLEEMENQRFLLQLNDFKGIPRLIGYPGNPLKFNADFLGEALRNGRKGFTFSFRTESVFRAPVYPF